MSIFSFFGVGVPAFLWALIIMYFAQTQLGLNVGGLFSEKYHQRALELGQGRGHVQALLDSRP